MSRAGWGFDYRERRYHRLCEHHNVLYPLSDAAGARLRAITEGLQADTLDLFDPAVSEHGYQLWYDVLHACERRRMRVCDLLDRIGEAIDAAQFEAEFSEYLAALPLEVRA